MCSSTPVNSSYYFSFDNPKANPLIVKPVKNIRHVPDELVDSLIEDAISDFDIENVYDDNSCQAKKNSTYNLSNPKDSGMLEEAMADICFENENDNYSCQTTQKSQVTSDKVSSRPVNIRKINGIIPCTAKRTGSMPHDYGIGSPISLSNYVIIQGTKFFSSTELLRNLLTSIFIIDES